jgi:hypothetical protein
MMSIIARMVFLFKIELRSFRTKAAATNMVFNKDWQMEEIKLLNAIGLLEVTELQYFKIQSFLNT